MNRNDIQSALFKIDAAPDASGLIDTRALAQPEGEACLAPTMLAGTLRLRG